MENRNVSWIYTKIKNINSSSESNIMYNVHNIANKEKGFQISGILKLHLAIQMRKIKICLSQIKLQAFAFA